MKKEIRAGADIATDTEPYLYCIQGIHTCFKKKVEPDWGFFRRSARLLGNGVCARRHGFCSRGRPRI